MMDAMIYQYQQLVELCPDLILIQCNNKIVYINTAGYKMLGGNTAADILGKSILDIIHVDFREISKERIDTLLISHRPVPLFEEQFVRLDGTVVDVETSIAPTTYNTLPEIQIFVRDVSDRKKAEKELADQYFHLEKLLKKVKKLRSADLMKSEFLANMSHELRTPLNAIIGFSEMLKDGLVGGLTPKQQTYCEEIFNSGNHLLLLINDILDISKIEAGKMKFEPANEDLPSLLENAMNLFKEKAKAQNIQLNLMIDKPIDTAYMDGQKIKQIIYNMLSNALKYTLRGSITLSCTIDSNNLLDLSVKDTGIGITEENIKHLFTPFYQIKEAQIKNQTGSGLGLVMIKHLAELHGGTVEINSDVGVGTTISVKIPYIHPTEAQPTSSPPPFTLIPSEKPSALVVEDDPKSAEIIRTHLSQLDLTFDLVKSAEEGLQLLEEKHFDLIILDIVLPGQSGWEMLSTIKQNKKLENTPVIIVSVLADEKKGIGLGALEVLQKPIGRYELTNAIQKYRKKGEINKPFTVLAVDDDPNVLVMIETYLKSKTCRIIGARNGKEALEHIKKQTPDLIILDLVMPETTGFDVVEHLRNNPKTSDIPVLVLTSKFLTEDDRHKLDTGVVKILMKNGLSATRFRNEIKRIIRH